MYFDCRIVVREQEKQFQKQFAILKEEQSQELQRWKIEYSAIARNEALEQSRAAKIAEESRSKRESGSAILLNQDNDKDGSIYLQFNDELLKLRKTIDERDEMLKEVTETQLNQNETFALIRSEVSNLNQKLRNVDEDLSKRIETYVDLKLSKFKDAPITETAMQKTIKDAVALMDAKIHDVSMQFKGEISMLKEVNGGRVGGTDLDQFKKDLNRIEDIACQALTQIQTLSRRYYYDSKGDTMGEPSVTKRSSIITEQSTGKRTSLRSGIPNVPDSNGPSIVQNRTSMLMSTSQSVAPRTRDPRRQENNYSTEGSIYKPKDTKEISFAESYRHPVPPTQAAVDNVAPRNPARISRISAVVTNGHVRERLKSLEETVKEESSINNRRSYLVSKRS